MDRGGWRKTIPVTYQATPIDESSLDELAVRPPAWLGLWVDDPSYVYEVYASRRIDSLDGALVQLGLHVGHASRGQGAPVEKVVEGSPAEQAGIRKGDSLVRVNDKDLLKHWDYYSLDSHSKLPDLNNVRLTLIRNAEALEVTLQQQGPIHLGMRVNMRSGRAVLVQTV